MSFTSLCGLVLELGPEIVKTFCSFDLVLAHLLHFVVIGYILYSKVCSHLRPLLTIIYLVSFFRAVRKSKKQQTIVINGRSERFG